jgi:hypothetical protein
MWSAVRRTVPPPTGSMKPSSNEHFCSAFVPFAGILRAFQHLLPGFLGARHPLCCSSPFLRGEQHILSHLELPIITIGKNRIAGVGSEFGKSLMPVLGFLSGTRIFCNLLNLCSGCNFSDIGQEEGFNPLTDTFLLVFSEYRALPLRDVVAHRFSMSLMSELKGTPRAEAMRCILMSAMFLCPLSTSPM